jgi:uncharacterized membrane protein YqjE
MAAGLHGMLVTAVVLAAGLVVAVIAFVREKSWPALRWLALLLYVVPLVVVAGAFAIGPLPLNSKKCLTSRQSQRSHLS